MYTNVYNDRRMYTNVNARNGSTEMYIPKREGTQMYITTKECTQMYYGQTNVHKNIRTGKMHNHVCPHNKNKDGAVQKVYYTGMSVRIEE